MQPTAKPSFAENNRLFIVASAFLVLAYAAFPVAMALGYVAMALAFVLGLCAWKSIRLNLHNLANPLVVASLGLYLWMVLGWSYSEAPTSDVTLHFSKYAGRPAARLRPRPAQARPGRRALGLHPARGERPVRRPGRGAGGRVRGTGIAGGLAALSGGWSRHGRPALGD